MTSDSAAGERSDPDERFDLAEHVVATSESSPPEETVARLLGTDRPGPDYLTEQFVEHDVAVGVEGYFLDEETRHELRFDDRVEYVPCVADALQAAVLVDADPVTVRSFDPVSGDPVTFEVADDGVEVTPPDHVVTIGVAEAVLDADDMVGFTARALGSDGPPDLGADDVRDLGCRYINAFETVENYERWAGEVDAVTVALPAEPLMPAIRRFVAGPCFDYGRN